MEGLKTEIADRLPWHKPVVQELELSLGTRSGIGALTDAENHNASLEDVVGA